MATAQQINKVAVKMPDVPHWEIERDINSGDINPDVYPEPVTG